MSSRVHVLQERISVGQGALIRFPENRRYFTNFISSAGFLIVTRERALFQTDSRYIEAAQAAVPAGIEVRETRGTLEADTLRELGIQKLSIEAAHTTIAALRSLEKICAGIEIDSGDFLDTAVGHLRAVKSRDEVEKIVRAQRIAERALEKTLAMIRPGVTEREIALSLDFNMLSTGAEALSFETIAVSGENSSKPHGVPGDRQVRAGDFITMDFGAVVDGYHSDMTRTVAVGSVTPEQRKVYDTVLAAQKAMLDGLRAGITCAQADALARDVIEQAGYGAYFRHSAGHGVGLEIHEPPFEGPRSQEMLRAGNIVTAEPGIYLPGRFGVRIEDMAYLTEQGIENLTQAPKELLVL